MLELREITAAYEVWQAAGLKPNWGSEDAKKTIERQTLERYKYTDIEMAGINKNIHTFRHTFATAALTKDIPILEVSRCLGHADANTTLKMYGHAMPGFNRHIIDLFQKKKTKSATKTATIKQQS